MDMREELTLEECKTVEKDTIDIIRNVFENYTPYVHIYTEEPYQNIYTGRISYDRSGEVEKANQKDIYKIVDELGSSEYSIYCCESEFDEFANTIKTSNWSPTYMSGCGKHWISFADEIQDAMRDYRYENFDIYDPDADIDCNDELDSFIENLMLEVYNNCSVKDYLPFVLANADTVKDDNILAFARISYGVEVEESEKYLPIVQEFKEKLTSLTGCKLISIVCSEGSLTVEMDEYGLIEDDVNRTESFYSFLISLISRESFGMTVRQIIGNDGENNIYKLYGLRFSEDCIEYITSSEMKLLHCLNPVTGELMEPEKNLYYSQLN